MARTKKAASASRTDGVNLERLTQSQASWLIGKPAVWLRDNAHLGGRNADGSYNSRELVRAVRGEFAASELAADQLEFTIQLGEGLASSREGRLAATVRHLDRIEEAGGAAAMAAVAVELRDQLREYHAWFGDGFMAEKPTPESIQEEAEQRIRDLATWDAHRELRVVTRCDGCQSYRWGREWKPLPIPKGWTSLGGTCPKCER